MQKLADTLLFYDHMYLLVHNTLFAKYTDFFLSPKSALCEVLLYISFIVWFRYMVSALDAECSFQYSQFISSMFLHSYLLAFAMGSVQ